MGVGGQRHASAALPTGKDAVPIVQEAGWAPGPVWTGAENLAPPPPGFDPRTVQPVASRYTDWTIAAEFQLFASPLKTIFFSNPNSSQFPVMYITPMPCLLTES